VHVILGVHQGFAPVPAPDEGSIHWSSRTVRVAAN
jgi:hypothetical protein